MSFHLHIDTPLLESSRHYSRLGRPVLFKMDALQPSGSFKLRGVGLLAAHEVENGAKALVCASGGNAGFAVSYAGRKLGVPVTIVVPNSTSEQVRDAISMAGANVMVHGHAFDEAHRFATDLAEREGAVYVHPFDHPMLWRGHGTLVDELVASGAAFDCIVTSVGGGGLLAGIVDGLTRNGLHHVPVFAVETVGASSFHQSLQAGRLVTLEKIDSIATSLGAKRVTPHLLEIAASHPITSIMVTDAQAVDACLAFADAHRVLVEPACGAALAALEVHAALLENFEHPVVEVCGGIGTSIAKLMAWKQQFAA